MHCLYAGAMRKTLSILRHRARPGAHGGAGALRRPLALPLLGLLTAGMLLLAPALAHAATTLTVVGTSDVNDSGLIPNLIKPEFQAAYPAYTLNYVPSATGQAIQSAENGNGSPSALIVHAASLENQFVAGGFSYNNQYGNAIFTNDFVLAGPNADPAGVGAAGANNIAQAFADVATAGAAGAGRFSTRPRYNRRGARELGAGAELGPPAGQPVAVHGERGRRRRYVPHGPRLQQPAVPGQWHRASGRCAELVLGQRRQPERERDCGERVHGESAQQPEHVLRPHRPRHLRLPVLRDGSARHGPEPQDRDARSPECIGAGWRGRTDQLLPRLHHQPEQAR